MWSKNASLDGGTLSLAGIPAAQLAKEFGTPAFFLDEDSFRTRAVAWNNGLRNEFGDHAGTIFYAAKSFISTAVAQWIEEGTTKPSLVQSAVKSLLDESTPKQSDQAVPSKNLIHLSVESYIMVPSAIVPP